ncbi:carbon storage regulator [Leifsonia sp. Leaf264]|uniref:carbon storage regulator n=1 Tax=Leifsonia sp. Leaf264 TaxID=1736314 RepID=UPI001F31C707|nr:carbon storage regulator [Leifsonia sp. Leaf264]
MTRKTDQKIIITIPTGETVEISILEVRGDNVRIGFEAPRSVFSIDRQEVADAVAQTNLEAAAGTANDAAEAGLKAMFGGNSAQTALLGNR